VQLVSTKNMYRLAQDLFLLIILLSASALIIFQISYIIIGNPWERWKDKQVAHSLTKEPIINLISAIEIYKEENGHAPTSLLMIQPQHTNKKIEIIRSRDNLPRLFRYSQYPESDGEVRYFEFHPIDRQDKIVVHCNIYDKCNGSGVPGLYALSSIIDLYGEPTKEWSEYKRDWEIAAEFHISLSSLKSDSDHEYMYWSSGDYPEWYSNSSDVVGWGRSRIRSNTLYGKDEFFHLP